MWKCGCEQNATGHFDPQHITYGSALDISERSNLAALPLKLAHLRRSTLQRPESIEPERC